MVRVYFVNGHTAELPTAKAVKGSLFTGDDSGTGHYGIACFDEQGTEVARFLQSQIIGYSIEPDLDPEDMRQLARDVTR